MAKKKPQEPKPMNLQEKNFRYDITLNYDRIDCGRPECDHDYGRCSRLENVEITKIDVSELAKDLTNEYKLPHEILPFVDRILRTNKLYDPKMYTVSVCGGYYGEEIDTVKLDPETAREVQEQIQYIVDHPNLTERVKYLLIAEYGYLLKELEDVTFEERTVDVEDIIMGQMDHYKKLDSNVVTFYYQHSGVCGVALTQPASMKVRLVDGYHRVAAAAKMEKPEVTLWVGRA